MAAYVKKHNVECDFWIGKTVSKVFSHDSVGLLIIMPLQLDVCMTDEVAEAAAKTFSDYMEAGGDISKIGVTTDSNKAEEVNSLLRRVHEPRVDI